MKFILVVVCGLCVAKLSYSQTWLDQAHQQQNATRIGVGFQAMEPTALIFQVYKGGFCSNDNTYANYLTVEAVAGFENAFIKSQRIYKEGTWQSGGFQGGINVYAPLYTLPTPSFSVQVHLGAGLQGGSRKYYEQSQTKSDDIFGGNLMLRFSITGRGIEIRDRLWFISYFVDAKYHKQFGEGFYYFRPSFGLVFRKVR